MHTDIYIYVLKMEEQIPNYELEGAFREISIYLFLDYFITQHTKCR
jgi:hypothetical protein